MRAAAMIQRDMLLFAEQKKDREKPVFTEIGSRSSDLDVTSDGRLHDKDEISLDTYRKMRKDPQVKACLLVMKLPILQLSWSLQAKTEEGKRISGWCEMMLSEYMDDSLPYYTREMLTALDFGRSITEKIWQLKMVPIDPDNPDSIKVEERIIPLKLKTYDPRNITIKMDPDTLQLEGALQHTGRSEIFIPANKLLIYSHEKEFNNYYGASVLQAAYKPWIIKEFLQRFWNIALERYGTPLSTMQIPQGGSISKAIALMDMVKTKAGIPLPEGYEMEIHNLANAGMSFKEAIEYQDVMIARSMLVPDLIFANSGSGAYALSQTHEGFFEMRLNGISQELGDIYTKYLIRPMVQYNFGEVREYPEFTYSKVGREDLQKLADIVDKLLKGKVIAPSESWIRERMGLPQPDDEAQEYLDKQKEVVMSGLENIQKANQGQQQVKEDNQDGKTNPTKIDGGKAAVDNPGVKKEGQKQQKTNNFGELTDEDLANYYTKDLRTAVRGLMKLGIKGE